MMTATMTTISSTTAGEGGAMPVGVNPEVQPPDLTEDEAMEIAMAQSYLGLSASSPSGTALASNCGSPPWLRVGRRPLTHPVTHTRSQARAATSSRAYTIDATTGFVLARAVGAYGLCRLRCFMAQTLCRVLILIFFDTM
jgi:hypothetical protein